MTKKTHLLEPQSHRAVAAKVLSVYLDVDQSNVTKLNRSFESAFTAKVHAIERTLSQEYEQRVFAACVSEIRKFLSAYKPAARGLVMFVTSNAPVWFREVNVGVTTDVRWGKEAYVQPFVKALDEVFRLLTKSLRRRFIGSAVIAANAPERQILEVVLAIDSRAERAQELEKVALLITSAAKDERAVATLSKTLEALHEKRVRELLYSQGFGGSGSVCPNCHALFADDARNCRFCDLPLKPTDDLVEKTVGAALAGGSSVEQLHGDAAKKLKAAGGIGAFLK